jgi:beta-glucanase (GH16 family)
MDLTTTRFALWLMIVASFATTVQAQPLESPFSQGCGFQIAGDVCPDVPPIVPEAGKHWTVAFSEEFSGTELDRSKLTPCFDWNYGSCTSSFNHGREHYQPSQVVVSNGTAKLIAAPLSPAISLDACQGGSCTYKAGLLSTARPKADVSRYLFAFTYGYVEARIKFPATQGFFTAFWMLPANSSFSYRSEIDILELLGDDPSTMFMTYHYAGRAQSYAINEGKFSNGACPVKDYSADFVRMGVDWQPDHIAWYIDGEECGRFTNAFQIESGPMQLILHMMVDNDWQRRWNVGLIDPTLVRQLEVDYIRVYQEK